MRTCITSRLFRKIVILYVVLVSFVVFTYLITANNEGYFKNMKWNFTFNDSFIVSTAVCIFLLRVTKIIYTIFNFSYLSKRNDNLCTKLDHSLLNICVGFAIDSCLVNKCTRLKMPENQMGTLKSKIQFSAPFSINRLHCRGGWGNTIHYY